MTRDDVALGLLLGYAADLALGDPRRYHPVAGFGRIKEAKCGEDIRGICRAHLMQRGLLLRLPAASAGHPFGPFFVR